LRLMCRWLAIPVRLSCSQTCPAPGLFADRPELGSRLGARRPTGTGSASAGMTPHRSPGSSAASSRPGMTRTCASSPGTSVLICSSRISARRSGRPFSRPTAIRSATAAGCGCTTGSSATSRRSNGPCGRGRRIAVSRDQGPDARLVVSEPIGELPGVWTEVPEASYGWSVRGTTKFLPITPRPLA